MEIKQEANECCQEIKNSKTAIQMMYFESSELFPKSKSQHKNIYKSVKFDCQANILYNRL